MAKNEDDKPKTFEELVKMFNLKMGKMNPAEEPSAGDEDTASLDALSAIIFGGGGGGKPTPTEMYLKNKADVMAKVRAQNAEIIAATGSTEADPGSWAVQVHPEPKGNVLHYQAKVASTMGEYYTKWYESVDEETWQKVQNLYENANPVLKRKSFADSDKQYLIGTRESETTVRFGTEALGTVSLDVPGLFGLVNEK